MTVVDGEQLYGETRTSQTIKRYSYYLTTSSVSIQLISREFDVLIHFPEGVM